MPPASPVPTLVTKNEKRGSEEPLSPHPVGPMSRTGMRKVAKRHIRDSNRESASAECTEEPAQARPLWRRRVGSFEPEVQRLVEKLGIGMAVTECAGTSHGAVPEIVIVGGPLDRARLSIDPHNGLRLVRMAQEQMDADGFGS